MYLYFSERYEMSECIDKPKDEVGVSVSTISNWYLVRISKPLIIAVLFASLSGITGCAPTRNALPPELVSKATVIGMPDVRDWGGEHSRLFQEDLVDSIRQARRLDPRGIVDEHGVVSILALSGGGAEGAFGAGLLNGWSDSGTRPTFKLVTGISTGALIAPFAFLGPDYDDTLKNFYTTITTKDILRARPMLGLLGVKDSLADSSPLAKLLKKCVTKDVLEAVAQAHKQGRRLYVGTTNLDACRLTVWNMGAIAASGKPGALELFRKIMLASASIPVAFPPVHIPVEAEGAVYDEMHVDGGVTTEVFFYGFMLDLDAAAHEAGVVEKARIKAYIIRNAEIRTEYDMVKPQLLPIASRAIANLIASQGLGDLYRIYTITQRDGIDFNLAYIPADHVSVAKEAFDPEEMQRLFDLGFRLAGSGYQWQRQPPGLVD